MKEKTETMIVCMFVRYENKDQLWFDLPSEYTFYNTGGSESQADRSHVTQFSK